MPQIERNGTSVFFDDQGDGTPIVLGHSFLCSGEMWTHQLDGLSERARVVNVDYRGHGRSGLVRKPLSLYDLVDDVVAVLDDLGIERAIWAGLSIGGMVSLRAALTHPDRVAGLVLMDTHAGAETAFKKLKYRVLGLGTKLFGIGPLLPSVLPLMFGRTTRSGNPALVAEWAQRFKTLDVPSMLHGIHALNTRDSVVSRLGEIRVPSLVVVGEEDKALPPVLSREIAAAIPDAELVVVPGAGHLSALEQPDAVNTALFSFLDRLGSGG